MASSQGLSAKRSSKEKNLKPTVLIVGSGEAFDTSVGNTSYLLSGGSCPTVLFDCGYQVPERLWAKNLHADIDALCFTHLHADHSFGVVPLLVRYWEENRKKPITLIGPRGTERFVRKLLDMGYPGISKRFNYAIRFITLSPSSSTCFGSLKLSVAPTIHSVLNYTVRVDSQSRSRPFSFSISGDGQITDASKTLVSDVDVHFQEVYCVKPEIPVHADFQTVSTWLKTTQIKAAYLSHFSRALKQQLAKNIQKTKLKISKPDLEVKL